MAAQLAEFEYDGIRLVGASHAGEETSIVAPELNLAFDFGRTNHATLGVDHVFLSHGHMDHAAGVAYYFSQRMFIDNRPGTMYAPAHLLDPVRRLLRVWGEIDGHEPPANLYAAQAGTDITLRKDLLVRPFEVNHDARRRDRTVAPSLGYSVIEVRHKLLDEFIGLEGPQIVELKKKGVAITRRVELPLIAYCGDTADGPFLDLDHVRHARVLLLECTFVEPDHLGRARAGFHTHVSDLPGMLARVACERVLLIHLSRRTLLADAREAARHFLGAEFGERVTFFMEHRPRKRR